jgi:hypothetical protein
MSTELIHDRGRGPELVGPRITVQDLFPYFLDPTATEASMFPFHVSMSRRTRCTTWDR